MSKLFERLMKARGIGEKFLHPKYEDLVDAFLLPDMEKAIERIREAVNRGEKVLIYGDYDVDGVTASTVMHDALKLAGVKTAEIMLPDRFADGYGMSPKVITKAKEMQAGLVITVDCGSGNKAIIEELNMEKIDTIVTDHHECPEELPEAIAVINPKRKDWKIPVEIMSAGIDGLAGVGVAFKVAQALAKAELIPKGQEKWLLDLVIIGTICDAMLLTGENRILGYYGMKVLEKTRRVGLKELAYAAGVKKIDSEAIKFQIGPRLNAAGRLETADISLKLMMAETKAEAAQLAEKLEELNKQRRIEQQRALREIKERGVSGVSEVKNELPAVVIETGEWHEGILGIIAGKLSEEYKRPAFALSEVAEGVLKGSGRSFGDFSLAEALNNCEDVIISGGGHAAACGVKVEQKKIWNFRERINEYYLSLNLKNQERFLMEHEDLIVHDFADFSYEFIEEMQKLEPFGNGNEEPIFKIEGVEIIDVRTMGADKQHLRLDLRDEQGKCLKCVAFFAPKKWLKLRAGEERSFLVRICTNEWNGVISVEARLIDVI